MDLISPGREIAQDRYYLKNEKNEIIETYNDMCSRVAHAVAAGESTLQLQEHWADIFYQGLLNQNFLCAGRFWSNAGTEGQQLPNCFINGIEDSKESIWQTLGKQAVTLSGGGGDGFNFSKLRSRGIRTTKAKGHASGPVSFLKLYDASAETIVQGGSRRGANMGVLDIDHPDIMEWIMVKGKTNVLRRFNISCGVFDSFVEDATRGYVHKCYEPHLKEEVYLSLPGINKQFGTGVITKEAAIEQRREYIREHYMDRKIVRLDGEEMTNVITNEKEPARDLIYSADIFDLLCYKAWECGDPGIIFLDKVNRYNPFIKGYQDRFNRWYFRASNPCAEELMGDEEICMLGHLVLTKYLKNPDRSIPFETVKTTSEAELLLSREIDFQSLSDNVAYLVRFLDDAIDVSTYPFKENEEAAKSTRRIGMGTLGLADLLILLGLKYGSAPAVHFTNLLYKTIEDYAYKASEALGEEKGSFPLLELCQKNGWYRDCKYRRNAILTTAAPTGTDSIIAGTFQAGEGVSSGIEPNFAFSYVRKDEISPEGRLVNHPLIKRFEEQNPGFSGMLPEHFVCAEQISYEDHIKMLSAIQDHIDSGISKTNNMPNDASVDDVKKAFLQAYKSSVKSFTIYRDGSKDVQVLNHNKESVSPEVLTSQLDELLSRPFVLDGKTFRIKTSSGHLFLTINSNSAGPCEVFLTIGKQGSDMGSCAEAIGRLISKSLQTFLTETDRLSFLNVVSQQLRGIQGSSTGFDGALQTKVTSIPDGVAILLQHYLSSMNKKAGEETSYEEGGQVAPNIHNPEVHRELSEEEYINQGCRKGNC